MYSLGHVFFKRRVCSHLVCKDEIKFDLSAGDSPRVKDLLLFAIRSTIPIAVRYS